MKLLLDEMWTPTIAIELRRRGYDVIAINEEEHASRYAGLPDDQVFARAQADGRAVVTDNIGDHEKARVDWEAHGRAHRGVLYALDPPFNRHRGQDVIGQMVKAIEHFLCETRAADEPLGRVHYLRSAPDG